MDSRTVVVVKDSDDDITSPIEQNNTIELSESEEDTMEKKERIPFLDLDPSPSPPKKSRTEGEKIGGTHDSTNKTCVHVVLHQNRAGQMRSTIQRAPEAEDGEIVSSPEVDAADIEIKIHAEMTSSEESEVEETKPKLEGTNKGADANVTTTPDDVIKILDTPEKETSKTAGKGVQDDFPQREQPVSKKRIVPVLQDDHEEIEIDHLEINVPSQKVKKSKLKASPKEKFSSPEKDRNTPKNRSPREELNRKRPYDVFDERRSHSDPEFKDRTHRPDKRSDEQEDLRKRLLMKKLGSDHRGNREQERGTREQDRGSREQDRGTRDKEKSSREQERSNRDQERANREQERGREFQDRSKERDKVRSEVKETDKYNKIRHAYDSKNRDVKEGDDIDYKRKIAKEKYKSSAALEGERSTNSREGHKRDKNRSKKHEDKMKKKKKKRHRDIEEERETVLFPEEVVLEKSPVVEEQEKVNEPRYDDISSDTSVHSSPVQQSKSPATSPEQTPDRSPPPSLSRSPSRSPTPIRSPTPERKRTYFPAIEGCRNVEEFTWLNRIEEGTYGVVYRAKDKRTDEVVALKRLKMEKEREGFPITSLREINTLLKSQHPNIVTVREIVVGSNMDKIYIVMDYVEHDLKSLMEIMTQPFLVGEVKTLMLQLLRGVRHMHDNWILHRDIKTSNLLLSHKGILKIGDFGLAREYGSPLKKYTSIVVTLWYRAPELLLGAKEYSTAIDVWSVGCVFAELLTMKPLFPGKSEIDQINRIFKELGTPNDRIWPGPPAYSELPQVKKMNIADHPYNILRQRFGATLTDVGFDLMNRLLTYDPSKRIIADEALKHGYFEESPRPVDPSMFPTWPAKSELGHKAVKRMASPKPPEGGQFNSQIGDDFGGFHMPSTKKGSSAKGLGFNLKF